MKIKKSRFSFTGVNLILMALLPPLFSLPSVLLGMTPPPPPSPPCLQLNLIHSEVSNLAGFDVEGVINPTNADLELKDDLGELPPTPIASDHSGEFENPSVISSF